MEPYLFYTYKKIMIKKYILIISILHIAFSFELGGCGTIANAENIRESSFQFRELLQSNSVNNRELKWVPVQFHIVQRDNGSGGLNEIILPTIIDDLNYDYINANIRFYQYSPVDYILDSDYYTTDGDVEINQLKSINNTNNVIDIYAVGSLNSGDNALCGISSFTWFGIQGIIVANGCFNRFTVNHEMGHYFNLFHPHETADGEEFVNGNGCQYRGDGICDTPADPNLSLPGNVSGCTYNGSAVDPAGQAYDDCQGYAICELYGGPDVGNIMSYSPDACVNHFTDEQYEKAEYTLITNRADYIQSPNFVEFNIVNQVIIDDGDGDLVINPGETIDLFLEIEIDEEWPSGASDIIFTLSTIEPNINILIDQFYNDELIPGNTFINEFNPFRISFNSNAELKEYQFNLNLSYLTDNNQTYSVDFNIGLDVSLNQFGFPYQTQSTVESSPAIFDIDNDGNNEIIFGDYLGNLNICEYDMQNCIVFTTEGQIWSSPAIADLDNDGEFEIVFASVDKFIYILNAIGELKYSYYTDQFLVGTPAIGNIDSDPELEIIIGGFSNAGKLFAINHDATLVDNFPISINEKMKKGVALADINSDDLDEIFVGTESYNLYRLGSNGAIFNNTPILASLDKIKFAPVIVNMNNEFYIIVGSTDGNLYGISPTGEIKFIYETGDEILSSASVVRIEDSFGIAFGSGDNFLYLIDNQGNDIQGWPQYIGDPIESSPVIADLNADGMPEIVITTNETIHTFNLESDIFQPSFNLEQTIKGNPVIADLDVDGDLEIFSGTNFNLSSIDIKTNGDIGNYWSIYRGNLKRTGFVQFEGLYLTDQFHPNNFEILQSYPNPFNNNLTLPIYINQRGLYIFQIYNIQGKIVKKNEVFLNNIGLNKLSFSIENLSSGQYFISCKNEIKVSDFIPIVLLK